jgi:hypothetical protein
MNLWQAREKSLEWLATELIEQNSLIDKGFELLDKCIALLNQQSKASSDEINGRFARVVNITLAKARNLMLGSYSMLLDAVAQEAGALLRPILEAYELLIYFRLEPSRIDQAIDRKLPSAGSIAKKIKGEFKDLRDSLNTNASHISFGYESAKHLIDYQTSEIKAIQSQTVEVFTANLTTLTAVQLLIVTEALKCLLRIENNSEPLIKEFEDWRQECLKFAPTPIEKF